MKSLNRKMLIVSLGLLTVTTNGLFAMQQNFSQQKETIIQNLRRTASIAFETKNNILSTSIGQEPEELSRLSPVTSGQKKALALSKWRDAVNPAVTYIEAHAGNSTSLRDAATKCQILNNNLVQTVRLIASPDQRMSLQEKIKTYSSRMKEHTEGKYHLNLLLSRLNNLQKSVRTKFYDKEKIAAFAVLTELITQLNIAVNKANIDFMSIDPQQKMGN